MEDVHTDSAAPAAAPMTPAPKKGMSGGLVVILGVLLLIIIGAWAYAMQKDDDSAVTGDEMMPSEQMPADDSGAAGTMETGTDAVFDASAGVEVQ